MHSDYADICDRIAESPSWWDENGVPRYGEFHPERLPNIYANECVLFLITCQDCGKAYHVGLSERLPKLANRIQSNTLHYGDPPNACGEDCGSGACMNSEPQRVLQYWVRPHPPLLPGDHGWVRNKALELDIATNWDEL